MIISQHPDFLQYSAPATVKRYTGGDFHQIWILGTVFLGLKWVLSSFEMSITYLFKVGGEQL